MFVIKIFLRRSISNDVASIQHGVVQVIRNETGSLASPAQTVYVTPLLLSYT